MKIKTIKTIKFTALIICTINLSIAAYAPTNLYRPHDIDFRMHEWKHNNLRIGAAVEYGQTSKCRDWDENKRNVLQLYNQTESSVAMLLGAPTGSIIDYKAKALGISAATITDDNTRGRFDLTGKYKEFDCTLFGKYKMPINLAGTFDFEIYMPVKSMRFTSIKWEDQTKEITSADQTFKSEISSQIAEQAHSLGGLNINTSGWEKTNIGDVILMLGWQKDFKQQKEYLKNARINTRIGVSIPTGDKRDENQSLSMPLGNDGAWGIPASLGLDLDFVYQIRAGIELDFFGIFDHTRIYRMKTNQHQTDFLLLHKGKATKSQGATWRFNLFLQAKKIFAGLSGMISYQFLKHDTDRLSPKSYDFSYSIVNSAENLNEWNIHNLIIQANFDPFGLDSKSPIKPQLSFFYKIPITGKRVIMIPSIGGQLSFNF